MRVSDVLFREPDLPFQNATQSVTEPYYQDKISGQGLTTAGGIQRIFSGDYIDRLKLNGPNEFIRTSGVVFWLAARE